MFNPKRVETIVKEVNKKTQIANVAKKATAVSRGMMDSLEEDSLIFMKKVSEDDYESYADLRKAALGLVHQSNYGWIDMKKVFASVFKRRSGGRGSKRIAA